ncbi:hypothetical protein JHD48_03430 [Sulfurimonas sp. SAG-AH-194-I05]|nr:hypothetical protein [Sulfurimonas sp. SAG-AH-194-I05]MDF1874786.1 hypothetical protein [Sulfurimonas sp. SAG-AH-194-I05]
MTIKNSLISVAASALLVSAITGCSSSDGTTTTTNAGVASELTVSKGYVQDANVTGWDANGTLLYTYAYKADSSGVYTVASDANSTSAAISEIDYITIAPKGALTVLHMLDDNGNDANLTGGKTFTIPAKGTTYINSITTLAYQMAAANTADYNLSSESNVSALISKIETALGVSGAATTDPKSNTMLNDINRLLGAMTNAKASALGVALITKGAPADLSAAIDNISAAAQTAGDSALKTFVDTAKTYILSGSLKHINLEKSLSAAINGTVITYELISTTSDLRIVSDSLQINGNNADGLPGGKIKNTGAVNVTFRMTTPEADADLNNTEATFFASFVAKEDNNSAAYTKNTKIAFELADFNMTNYSDGKVKFTPNDSNLSKVIVAVTSTTDEGVSYSDSWSLKDLTTTNTVITDASTNGGVTTFDVDLLYAGVKAALDANHTTSASAAAYTNLSLNGGISDVTIGLKAVKSDGTTMSVLNYNTTTSTAYATVGATVGASSGSALYKQSSVDFRGGNDANNTAPSINNGTDLNTTATDIIDGQAAFGTIDGVNVTYWNISTTGTNAAGTLNLNFTGADDGFENNTSVAVSMASTIDGNSTTKSVDFLANEFNTTKLADVNITAGAYAAINFMVDMNHTIASNPTGRHPMATYTFIPTDEFGKVGNETNLTIALNRAPSAFTLGKDITITTDTIDDINGTYTTETNTTEVNTTALAGTIKLGGISNSFTDPDGDTLYTLAFIAADCGTTEEVANNEVNTTATNGLSFGFDSALATDVNLTVKEIGTNVQADTTCKLQIRAYDQYNVAAGSDVNISITIDHD